jgi:ribokinase
VTEKPIVVVGAHIAGLLVRVEAVPREGETVLGHDLEDSVDGGKSSNQAVAAAKLGAPTVLVTLLGDDERGREARHLLASFGIDTRWCFEAPGSTDVGFVILPPSKVPAIVSGVDRSAQIDGSLVRRAAGAFDGAACVVCCLEASQQAAVAAFELGRAAGATTILNAAPSTKLEPQLLRLVDVLVLNEHEAAALAGTRNPPAAAKALLRRTGAGGVVVTAGAEGAVVADGAGVHAIPAPLVETVDTTGAGDALTGALAVALRSGASLVTAAELGVRAASLSVTRPGTMLAYPTAPELQFHAKISA